MSQAAFVGGFIDARTADSTNTAVIVRVPVTYIDTTGRADGRVVDVTIDVADAISQIQVDIAQAVIDLGPSVGGGYTLTTDDVVQQ